LLQRGLGAISDAKRFIDPKVSDLGDPFLLQNMDKAVALLDHHMRQNSPISIIGDYDVDGITSTVLLIDILRKFGIHPQYFIPRRFSEGYGMSQEIVRRMLKNSNPHLVIALDCGTNSLQEINLLRQKNIDVLIIDHHTLTLDQIPNAVIINPHLSDENTTLKTLCTVGLVFKFVHAFLKYRRQQGDEVAFKIRLKNSFDLTALGIIADIMPIRDDNRILVKYGLQSFAKNRRPGLNALCSIANIPPEQAISRQDVSFKLAPRMNVSGRLSDAQLQVELLLADHFAEAMAKAQKIEEMNQERRCIESKITLEAEKMVQEYQHDDPGIVLFHPHWHSGVIGIVAGKLSQTYNRPVVVLTFERGLAKGSGRSTNDHLVSLLTECSKYVETWGGHKMAVGISLKPENVDAFRTAFNQSILKFRKETSIPGKTIEVAYVLDKNDIDECFVQALENNLQPFGNGNEEPIFCIKNVQLLNHIEYFGTQKNHVRFRIEREYQPWLTVIAWDMASRIPQKRNDVDVLVTIAFNTWNYDKSILLTLVDWHYSK
jgi:single-stranded-DNA-specific exonuclease